MGCLDKDKTAFIDTEKERESLGEREMERKIGKRSRDHSQTLILSKDISTSPYYSPILNLLDLLWPCAMFGFALIVKLIFHSEHRTSNNLKCSIRQ